MAVMDHHPVVKGSLDILSLIVVFGTLADYLPAIAAGLSIAWYIYSFYRVWKERKSGKKFEDYSDF